MLTIRTADRSDIPALDALLRRSVEGSCAAHYSPAQIAAWVGRSTPARWHELMDSGLHFFAALQAGRLAGFASVSVQGFLHSLFVDPACQRCGVASALLAAGEAYARSHGARRMSAEVSLAARPFFERRGWRTLRMQRVALGEELLTNFRMEKSLVLAVEGTTVGAKR